MPLKSHDKSERWDDGSTAQAKLKGSLTRGGREVPRSTALMARLMMGSRRVRAPLISAEKDGRWDVGPTSQRVMLAV
jgi:hypothetical protein